MSQTGRLHEFELRSIATARGLNVVASTVGSVLNNEFSLDNAQAFYKVEDDLWQVLTMDYAISQGSREALVNVLCRLMQQGYEIDENYLSDLERGKIHPEYGVYL